MQVDAQAVKAALFSGLFGNLVGNLKAISRLSSNNELPYKQRTPRPGVHFRENEREQSRTARCQIFLVSKSLNDAGQSWRAANINNRLTHGCFDVDKRARAMRIFIIIGAHQTTLTELG